jgi:hypothetical protein
MLAQKGRWATAAGERWPMPRTIAVRTVADHLCEIQGEKKMTRNLDRELRTLARLRRACPAHVVQRMVNNALSVPVSEVLQRNDLAVAGLASAIAELCYQGLDVDASIVDAIMQRSFEGTPGDFRNARVVCALSAASLAFAADPGIRARDVSMPSTLAEFAFDPSLRDLGPASARSVLSELSFGRSKLLPPRHLWIHPHVLAVLPEHGNRVLLASCGNHMSLATVSSGRLAAFGDATGSLELKRGTVGYVWWLAKWRPGLGPSDLFSVAPLLAAVRAVPPAACAARCLQFASAGVTLAAAGRVPMDALGTSDADAGWWTQFSGALSKPPLSLDHAINTFTLLVQCANATAKDAESQNSMGSALRRWAASGVCDVSLAQAVERLIAASPQDAKPWHIADLLACEGDLARGLATKLCELVAIPARIDQWDAHATAKLLECVEADSALNAACRQLDLNTLRTRLSRLC